MSSAASFSLAVLMNSVKRRMISLWVSVIGISAFRKSLGAQIRLARGVNRHHRTAGLVLVVLLAALPCPANSQKMLLQIVHLYSW